MCLCPSRAGLRVMRPEAVASLKGGKLIESAANVDFRRNPGRRSRAVHDRVPVAWPRVRMHLDGHDSENTTGPCGSFFAAPCPPP
jgi:hypothetical protein